MKNLLSLFLALFIGINMAPTGWTYYKEVTIQDAYVDANQTDFPFLFWFDNDADIGGRARADGFDLRFTVSPHGDADLLKYEREQFVISAGLASGRIWVKVPSILATGGATVRCYYGKADAPDGEDAQNVWDTNFMAVYHLREATNPYLDSTANNNDSIGTNGAYPTQIDGKVYKGQDFESGNDNNFYMADSNSLDIGTSDFSISAWVKLESYVTGQILFKNNSVGYSFYTNDDDHACRFDINDGTGSFTYYGATTIALAEWHHVTMRVDRDSATGAYQLIDGVVDSYGKKNPTGVQLTLANALTAKVGSAGHWLSNFDGIIDELRLSNIVRADAWDKFEVYNINESDHEQTWGSEQGAAGYTLSVDPGSYALTGQTVGTFFGRKVGADGGSYLLSGQIAGVLFGRKIEIDSGVYSLSGQTLELLHNKLLEIEAGSYSLVGQTAGLLFNRVVSIGAGSYIITGQDIGLLHNKIISIGAGVYALTGQDVTLTYISGYVLNAEAGSYTLAGQAADLLKAHKLSLDAGAYVLTGQDAATLLGRLISAEGGSYGISGQIADLLRAGKISIGSGAYLLIGTDAGLTYSGVQVFPIIFDVLARQRIFDSEDRDRISDVEARDRIFDVKRRDN